MNVEMTNRETPKDRFGSIEFSLKYPFSNADSTYGAAAYGLASVLVSMLVIPAFLVIGYLFDLRQAAANDRQSAPRFEGFENLIREGMQGVIAYTPLLSLIFLSLVAAALVSEIFLGFIGIAIYLFPAVGVLYAVERDSQEVYSKELITLVSDEKYFSAFIKYLVLAAVLISIFITFSFITLGIGAVVLIPLLLYSRAAYWGYVYANIRENSDELP